MTLSSPLPYEACGFFISCPEFFISCKKKTTQKQKRRIEILQNRTERVDLTRDLALLRVQTLIYTIL